ncbi:MAG: hypothetical protein Q9171_002502 [Xanthocarpia ochracea]
MLGGEWREANQSTVTVKDITIPAIEIWFQVLHEVNPNYNVPIPAIWHLANIGGQFRFDILKLKYWFAEWYERQPVDLWYANYKGSQLPDPRCLLYPCWVFDHYKGFMKITSFCAYRYTGHIMEINPSRHHDLHLPARVIQQLNAAKGRLRTVLHRDLYEPNDQLLRADCICKAETLWGYEKALTLCGAWPLERVAQHTAMYQILELLRTFSYTPPSEACSSCRQNYKSIVEGAESRSRCYFDGLCLDCMGGSKESTAREDSDYWNHNDPKENDKISGCREEHTQPTWYFSYMGRRQRKDTLYRSKTMERYEGDSE